MINFPSSPSAGQKFTSGKTLYTFTNGVWRASNPTALPFNYLVNPALSASQQNGDNFGAATGYYAADQWWRTGSLPGGIQRFTTTTPLLAPYYVQWYASPAKVSLAATDYISLYHYIEGSRIADLQWGTANAKPIVVRFAASTGLAGNYALSVRNAASTRSYVVPVALTGALQEFVLPIPGCTDGVWPTDNTMGMAFTITGATGTTYQTGSPNSWQPSNYLGFTGMSNQASVDVSVIIFGRAGLYADPDNTGRAPPWEQPSQRQVLQDCMRYWFKAFAARGFCQSATTAGRMALPPPVPMRAQPALGIAGTTSVLYDIGAAPPLTAVSACYGDAQGSIEFDATGAAGGMTGGRACIYTSTAPANYIAVNARM